MKQTEVQPLFAEERQEQIVALLSKNSKLLVPELCDYFQVSPATIRSDLRDLAAKGRLKRTHGGAIPISKTLFEPTSDDKKVQHAGEKRAIAALAARLVENGDTIAIDAGTTMMELCKNLVKKEDLTIVVNDLNIALYQGECDCSGRKSEKRAAVHSRSHYSVCAHLFERGQSVPCNQCFCPGKGLHDP